MGHALLNLMFVLLLVLVLGCTAIKKIQLAMADNPFKGSTLSIDRGKSIYVAHCASCHGAEGLGDGPGGVKLNPRPTNLQRVVREEYTSVNAVAMSVAYGKNEGMEAFLGKLTMEQVWDVSNYVVYLADRLD